MVIKSSSEKRDFKHPPVENHPGCDAELMAVEFPSGTWVLGCMECGESVLAKNLSDACGAWNQKNRASRGPLLSTPFSTR